MQIVFTKKVRKSQGNCWPRTGIIKASLQLIDYSRSIDPVISLILKSDISVRDHASFVEKERSTNPLELRKSHRISRNIDSNFFE